MKKCWSCDKEVAEGSPICPYCRAPLSEESINAMKSVPGSISGLQIVVGALVKERYEIKEKIGEGGMGVVFRAWDRTMEREVAIKVIPEKLCQDPRAIAALRREMNITLDLNHEHIVNLYSPDTWEGHFFIVMEYIGGGTLAHVFGDREHLGLSEALPYLAQIASAIDYAHNASPAVIHRDLKPLNILLTKDGRVKVVDFGLARVLRDSASRVSGTESAGTLAYMAPEQIRGKGVGRHTDIYALAAIAYELLSGHPPFYTGDLRWQILHEEVEQIPGQSAQVNAALQRGLAKEPDARPDSARELVALLAGEEVATDKKKAKKAAPKKPVQPGAAKPAGGRGKILSVLLAIVVLIGAGFAGWHYFQNDVKQLLRGGPVLSVTSEPPGAMVSIDDGKVGPSPASVARLPDGTHTLKLELERYQPYQEKVFIQGNKPVTIGAKLTPEPFGDLSVTSEPTGAKVIIDGKERGESPVKLTRLDQGNRTLQLSKDGFDPWQRQVEIKPLQPAEVNASLVSKFGRLTVNSEPPGAGVFIDGNQLGVTPFAGEAPKGKQNVTVKLAKFKEWQGQALVTLDTPAKLMAKLDLAQGTLRITSDPSGASIKVDGKDVGKSPLSVEHLQGLAEVEVEAPGRQPAKQQVQVQAGQEALVSVKLEPPKAFTEPTTGMEFVLVPGGCFQMGDTFGDGQNNEKPVHEVCIDSFYLGKYEVTQGEYQKIIGNNPSGFKKGDRYPVEKVSWNDTQEYLKKLNNQSSKKYRLPTEAEWEYAARSGGKKEKYAGGDDIDAVAWYDKNSGSSTHPVGGKRPNGLGLYDMSGNVWEWCQDWYDSDYYGKSPKNNPEGPSSGSTIMFRGGSFYHSSIGARPVYRRSDSPSYRDIVGFRLALQFSGPRPGASKLVGAGVAAGSVRIISPALWSGLGRHRGRDGREGKEEAEPTGRKGNLPSDWLCGRMGGSDLLAAADMVAAERAFAAGYAPAGTFAAKVGTAI